MTTLGARGLGISFGGLRALDGVDLDVAAQEIIGIIGPNGAGKTTLLDALSGFIPAEGTVSLGGRDVTGLAPHERAAAGLGRSFQDARLFPTMTVLEAMRVSCELAGRSSGVFAHLGGLPRARAEEQRSTTRVVDLIGEFGLSSYRDKLVRELSTGTRRIVDLACVVAQGPSVVLLDEPSSGIAQREAEALGPLLQHVGALTGCAMVVIEHDMPLLLGIADRLYALETGRLITSGTPDEVIHHPEVVRSYLGGDLAAILRSGATPTAATPSSKPGAKSMVAATATTRRTVAR